jgi:hypothetical protein
LRDYVVGTIGILHKLASEAKQRKLQRGRSLRFEGIAKFSDIEGVLVMG